MNIKNCEKIVEEDKKYLSKVSRATYYPLAVKKAKGCMVEDEDGNEFIDLLSSAAVINTGHSHPKIVQAIKNQADRFIQYTSAYMYHKPLIELSKRLVEITPGNYEKKIIYGLSGSDSSDGAIKLARAFTGRSKIISFIQSYHGSTYGALSMSAVSLGMRKNIGPFLPEMYHFNYPTCYRCPYGKEKNSCELECLKQIEIAFEYYIPANEVAAVVIEPIAGDAGVVVPPKEFIRKLYELCKANNILFVVDEVQTGFGRTGKWFGIQHFDIVPDIMILGKAIASGMPLSALVASAEIVDSLDTLSHAFTNAANPLSCVASKATIDIIDEEKLVENSKIMGDHFLNRLENLKKKYKIIGDIRGKGLSIGVDLITDEITKEKNSEAASKICYRAWEKGLILTFFAKNVLRIQPPLTIDEALIDESVKILDETMEEYMNGDISDDVLKLSKGW
ncbi:MAG: aspartate aminotransferase family protein [Bacillota bacterium]|nr:aspartate aminotransferase family protein [Bacillota bacterium]